MLLEIDRVTLRYASPRGAAPAAAVDAVSLKLPAGRIGALIGPSGCGKTSLLRLIGGLERPLAGRITLDGVVLSDPARGVHVAAEHRRIGMLFQEYALFPHLSVERNVAFGIRHLGSHERRRRAGRMLELVGLAEAASRAPHELSGGQQQRVALARALAPAPRLLLLDEPFSSLDGELRERLAQELCAILRETGTTALLVTHDQQEAFAVGDLVGVMRDGRLEQWDDAYTLYHRPATRFVAEFIGHGVFAPAKIVATGAGPAVQTPLGALGSVADCPLPEAYPDGNCVVLLRADDVIHDDSAPMKARIERKVFRGATFLYTLSLPDGSRVVAHVPSHHDHQVGDWIGIRAAVDHVVTFEASATTGRETG